jgi:hypothetical protein
MRRTVFLQKPTAEFGETMNQQVQEWIQALGSEWEKSD